MIGILQTGTRLVIGFLDRILEPFVECTDCYHLAGCRIEFITHLQIVRISILQFGITDNIRIPLEIKIHIWYYLTELRPVDRTAVSSTHKVFRRQVVRDIDGREKIARPVIQMNRSRTV